MQVKRRFSHPSIGGILHTTKVVGFPRSHRNASVWELTFAVTGCHRRVGMVFGYRLRGLLSPLLNDGNIRWLLDTVSRGATEVCEEFYDTLLWSSWTTARSATPPLSLSGRFAPGFGSTFSHRPTELRRRSFAVFGGLSDTVSLSDGWTASGVLRWL